MDEERVKPLRVTDHDTGTTYELDFSRESVKFAEDRGFIVDNVRDFPQSAIPALWFYAFRKNYGNRMPRNKTDALLDRLGGLTIEAIARLRDLFVQAQMSNVVITSEDAAKNASVTVEIED